MKLAIARSGIVPAFATLLLSCGGSGGDGNGGGGSGSDPRVTASPTNISVTATPGQVAPVRTVTLTVTNPPAAGLSVEGQYSASGIEAVDFAGTSPTQAILTIYFRSPGSLSNGTYQDDIELHICLEQPCVNEIRGSPLNISTSYALSGTGTSAATIDRNSIQIGADADDQHVRTETVRLTLNVAPATPVHVQASHSSNSIQGTSYRSLSPTQTEVDITFAAGQTVGHGTHNDTVHLSVCYDTSCVRQLQGSPFSVTTTMTVGAHPEPGIAPLDVLSRVTLPHDVIDAEFSKALNKVVMVGSYPVNALYVYDVATGIERQQSLNRVPTAVSISPDGLTAAVGHDALITIVELSTIGLPGAPTPVLLNVSTVVFDIVLDGNGYVHALPLFDQWVEIHTVHIASNTEALSTGASLRAGSYGRLHPSGNYIYAANNGLSPDDIEKWDIRQGAAAWAYDSPYHGDFGMCGNLWFNEPGTTIYTACGNTFRASEVRAEDMVYAGRIELSVLNTVPYLIRALSQSEAVGEIALIEYDLYRCEIAVWTGPCYHHLALYEDTFLNRQAVYALGPLTINGTAYSQRGLFVFHDAGGATKYLISRLHGVNDPAAEYYLSVVQ